MTGKRSGVIAMIAIAVTVSAVYAAAGLAPPAVTRISGGAQYLDLTFAEHAERAGIVVEGRVGDVRVGLFSEETTKTAKDGGT